MGKCKEALIYGALVLIQLCWGLMPVIRTGTVELGALPMVFNFYRVSFALLLMYILAVLVDGLQIPKTCHIPRFLFLGVLNYGIIAGYFTGMAMTSLDVAMMHQCAIPLWAALLGVLTGTERISAIKTTGVLTTVLGAVITTYCGICWQTDERWAVLGNVLLVVQTLATAAMVVVQRPMFRYYPHASVVVWGFISTELISILTALPYAGQPDVWKLTGQKETFIQLMYEAVVATFIAFLVLAWANKYVKPSVVCAFLMLRPVFTLYIYYFSHHDPVTSMEASGTFIVIAGLIITYWARILRYKRIRDYESNLVHYFYKSLDETSPDIAASMRNKEGIIVDFSKGTTEGILTADKLSSCEESLSPHLPQPHFFTPSDRRCLSGTGLTPYMTAGLLTSDSKRRSKQRGTFRYSDSPTNKRRTITNSCSLQLSY